MKIFLITNLSGTLRSSSTALSASRIPSTSPYTAACPGGLFLLSFFVCDIISNYNRQSHSFSDSSAQLSVHFFSTQSKAGFLDVARGRRAALSRRPPPSSAPRAGWTPAARPPAPRCPRLSPPRQATPAQTRTGSLPQISDCLGLSDIRRRINEKN